MPIVALEKGKVMNTALKNGHVKLLKDMNIGDIYILHRHRAQDNPPVFMRIETLQYYNEKNNIFTCFYIQGSNTQEIMLDEDDLAYEKVIHYPNAKLTLK